MGIGFQDLLIIWIKKRPHNLEGFGNLLDYGGVLKIIKYFGFKIDIRT